MNPSPRESQDLYPSTAWTDIRGAAGDSPQRENLWQELIRTYRAPIEASLRARLRGWSAADVEACVDEFFAYLFEHAVLGKADPAVGRFRAFVQGVAARFVLAWSRRENRDRPVGHEHVLDCPVEPAQPEIERAEERAWALALVSRALAALQHRYPEQAEVFHELSAGGDRHALATRLGITANAVSLRYHKACEFVRGAVAREVSLSIVERGDFDAEMALLRERLTEAQSAPFVEAS